MTAEQWETIRAEREAGSSFPELGARFGLSHQAIQKRAKADAYGGQKAVGEEAFIAFTPPPGVSAEEAWASLDAVSGAAR
jgi:hypothetical protein